MKTTKIWIILLAFGLILIACSASPLSPVPASPAVNPPGATDLTPTGSEPPGETPVSPGLRELEPVQAALADLSARLGLPPDSIDVVKVEEITWPDTSLGCAQPGQAYLQVLTPGHKVYLETETGQFIYHTDSGRIAVLCKENDMDPISGSPGAIQPGLEPFVDQAVADLADRLGVPVEKVEVLEAAPVVWPDGALGCPQPDMLYTQVQVEGYQIKLVVGEDEFSYHGGGSQGPFLCEQP